MKIKRFFARDIRQAIGKVRDELGPDAVVLSNRSVDGGVEIVAAIDYDDSIFEDPDAAIAQAAKIKEEPPAPPAPAKPAPATTARASRTPAKPARPEPARVIKAPERGGVSGPDLSASRKWAEDYLRTLQESSAKPEPSRPAPAEERPAKSARTQRPVEEEIFEEEFNEPAPAAQPVERSQPALAEMQQELQSLRSLLEHQLSSLAWGDLARRYPKRAKLLRRLMEIGLSPQLSRAIMSRVAEEKDFERVWRKALAVLAQQIPVVDEDKIARGGIVALIGPTGVGKTTTVAKLAARFALRHGPKKIALITTDSYRIGAQEQLRTYGRILGVPVRVADDAEQLAKTLKGLYDKDLVLIDTAGMSQRDLRLTEQFAMLNKGSPLISTYLVLSASAQMPVLDETVRAYSKVHLAGCILTKLDETARLGGALSVIVQNRLPIAYVSDGQRVPEDINQARGVSLVNRCVDLVRQTDHRLENETIEMAFGGLAANDHS